MHRALFGVQEVAELLGLTKQSFNQRLKQDFYKWGRPKVLFPDPAYIIKSGRIWTWEQMEQFVIDRQRVDGASWKENKELRLASERLKQIGQMEMNMDGSVQK